MQADFFNIGVQDADYPALSIVGFVRLCECTKGSNCFLFNLKYVFTKSNCSYMLALILISLLNYLRSIPYLVKTGRAPLTLLLPKEDTAWTMETLQLCVCVYSLHFHTEGKQITLCGSFVVVICMYVSNLSLWFLHWRVNANFI